MALVSYTLPGSKQTVPAVLIEKGCLFVFDPAGPHLVHGVTKSAKPKAGHWNG